MWNPLDEVVRRQKAGEPHGFTSVCSAHPLVIEAAVRQAHESGGTVLAEATSNQVDQYGGYTGMRPEDFRELVHGIAAEHGLPLERVVLGGDHLDCSFSCADDVAPLTDDLVADRTARLVRVAESTAGDSAGTLRHVIGTEVPVPGAPTCPTSTSASGPGACPRHRGTSSSITSVTSCATTTVHAEPMTRSTREDHHPRPGTSGPRGRPHHRRDHPAARRVA
ncbi:class II D-tagatose-bisphosphate aldolase, non-catalytic subunit [Streptomyces sp. NPDC007162]|uniref:class II D-tagatose-bisphosphate aldolase non-catalytic subunit n=1 Tax=Streptomyces sp. NPDC007162 TaxID=3156917 RepID=UPI0033DAA12A